MLPLRLAFGEKGADPFAVVVAAPGQPLVIALIAVPILVQVYFNAGLAYWLSRRFGVAWCVAAPAGKPLPAKPDMFVKFAPPSVVRYRPGNVPLSVDGTASRIVPRPPATRVARWTVAVGSGVSVAAGTHAEATLIKQAREVV